MARSEPLRARRHAPSIDEIRAALVASGVLEALEMANDDLGRVETDPDLLRAMTITYELLMTLDDSGVLDTFFRLPKEDQANFLRWIGATDDEETRSHRADTFVRALEAAPLAGPRSGPSGEARSNRA